MGRKTLIFRYGAFAGIATVANLTAQRVVLGAINAEFRFAAALCAGTIVGLVLKYILDKRWIFYYSSHGIVTQGKKFSLYTLTGVVTTLIFWGMETAFWLMWHTELMRETGAVLGLVVGYILKYNLDRRFVFTKNG